MKPNILRCAYWQESRWFTPGNPGVLRVVGRRCAGKWVKTWETENRIGWPFICGTIRGTVPIQLKQQPLILLLEMRDLFPAEIVLEHPGLGTPGSEIQYTCQRVSPLHSSRTSWWAAHQGKRLRTFSRMKRKLQIWGSLSTTADLTDTQLYCVSFKSARNQQTFEENF